MTPPNRTSHSGTLQNVEAEVEHLENEVDELLGKEYEHEPVPLKARRSTFSVSMIWVGFPMIITGTITGSLLVAGMGFQRALLAMILGNILMFTYVGALGALGTGRGFNFALLASTVFGRKGYMIASGLLSTLLLGWFAVQTGITGELIHNAFNINYIVMTAVAGLIYVGITFMGIRGLHWIGVVSVPLFVVLAAWVVYDAVAHSSWDAVMAYAGANTNMPMAFGVGLTVVLSLFIDAGTVTADFNRWAKDKSSSLIATFSAFPIANLLAMLAGGVMTAALAVPNANPFGNDNMFGYMLNQKLGWLSVLAFVFLLSNLGSVCSHCLYNASVGWARVLRSHMRLLVVVLGAVGIIVAAANIWAFFIQWLSLLGILVPPIGAIIIVDLYFVRPGAGIDQEWRPKAFIAWIVGSATAFMVETFSPQWSTALSAALAGGFAYWILAMMSDRAVVAAAK